MGKNKKNQKSIRHPFASHRKGLRICRTTTTTHNVVLHYSYINNRQKPIVNSSKDHYEWSITWDAIQDATGNNDCITQKSITKNYDAKKSANNEAKGIGELKKKAGKWFDFIFSIVICFFTNFPYNIDFQMPNMRAIIVFILRLIRDILL